MIFEADILNKKIIYKNQSGYDHLIKTLENQKVLIEIEKWQYVL